MPEPVARSSCGVYGIRLRCHCGARWTASGVTARVCAAMRREFCAAHAACGAGADTAEWPADLRVRESPGAR